MAEFTVILEQIVPVFLEETTHLVMKDRYGDVIEAEDIDHAWELARQKHYADQPDTNIQIADIVPGNVEVTKPELVQPESTQPGPQPARFRGPPPGIAMSQSGQLEQFRGPPAPLTNIIPIDEENGAAASQPAQTE